jgi:hypothetical protein
MSIEEEEIKVKDIENIFNKIIAENFQSWEREFPIIGGFQNNK